MSSPGPRCACCAAGECPHAAQNGLNDLRARFGHAIQVVADPGDDEAFMYTVGADPEGSTATRFHFEGRIQMATLQRWRDH